MEVPPPSKHPANTVISEERQEPTSAKDHFDNFESLTFAPVPWITVSKHRLEQAGNIELRQLRRKPYQLTFRDHAVNPR